MVLTAGFFMDPASLEDSMAVLMAKTVGDLRLPDRGRNGMEIHINEFHMETW